MAVGNLAAGEKAKTDIERSTGREGVAEVWKLDLCSFASIKAFASKVSSSLGRIDAVIENAGVMLDKFELVEGNETCVTVNVISTFLLAALLMPQLMESARMFGTKPRLVFVGSALGFQAQKELAKSGQTDMFKGFNDAKRADMDQRYDLSKLVELVMGKFLSGCQIKDWWVMDWVTNAEGQRTQKQIYKELVAILEEAQPLCIPQVSSLLDPMATTDRSDGTTSGTDTPVKDSNTRMPFGGTTTSNTTAQTRLPSEKGMETGAETNSDGVKEAATSPAEEPDEYPHGGRLVVIMIALCMAIFLTALDQTIIDTAIPKITDEFQGLDKVSWYGSAYFMTFGGSQPSWGKIYRYFTLKTTFLVAVLLFEVGSLICGVAPSANVLIVGRAIAGLGGAGLATGVLTIVSFSATSEKRPMLMGITGSMYGLAAVCGPLLGGAFTDRVTWRWCFYINLPIGGVSAAVMFLFLKMPSSAYPAEAALREKLLQLDLVGVILCMGLIVSYVTALQYGGQTKAWNSSTVIGLLVGFVAIGVTFAAWEAYQGDRAMLPLRLIKQRRMWVNSLFSITLGGSYYSVLYYLPIYFQSVQNVDAIESGVRNLPTVISVTLALIISGGIVSKTGHAVPVQAFGSALATICAGLYYTMNTTTSTGKWIGYQIMGGVGWGVAYSIPNMIIQTTTPPADLSTANAMILFFQVVGGAFVLSAAESGFVNETLHKAATTAPDVSPATLIATGASDIHTAFSADQVPGVLRAYLAGLRVVWAITCSLTGVSFVTLAFASWKRIHGGSAAGTVA
ncbi:Efflux pump antibiotic resistance protein [Pleurostoma richardsiae]|uniref:Efflux pump antibiotic resistance protein n=1 Tax=Pleurostoma richardsiae TaxID=41990 RepID=A0AA38VT86_9PEZI|nr:Efflux pump antibiotic resistance protein [Pleurostoma richardsiae]